MKLEFLDNISDNGKFPNVESDQLVRLYDFDATQAGELKKEIQEVILAERSDLDITSLQFIKSVNCNLILRVSKEDRGLMTFDKRNFICAMTIPSYEKMALMIAEFSKKETSGYQWLYDLDCPIDFLFSPGGTW